MTRLFSIKLEASKSLPLLDLIKLIKNQDIALFTIDFLENIAPDYFWKIPASTTGKYHPEDTRGEGGLINHVRHAVKVALVLFDYIGFTRDEEDMIISALLLHDCFKVGYNESKYTTHAHPIICSNEILTWLEEQDYYDDPLVTNLRSRKLIAQIADLVGTHMGNFTESADWMKKYNKEAHFKLRAPMDGYEVFVHLCDFIASRLHILDDENLRELAEVSELIGISFDDLKSCINKFNK